MAAPEREVSESVKGSKKVKPSQAVSSVRKREKLIIANRGAAFNLARYFVHRWAIRMDQEELRSIADIALCEAALRFKPSMGTKFTTYLFFYVKSELIKVIRHEALRGQNLQQVDQEMLSDLQHDESSSFEESCVAMEACPETQLHLSELREGCRKAVAELSSMEKSIVFEVYVNERKVASVARMMGYSRGHVSDLRRRALNKMKGTMVPYKEAA